jgi:hypothetical protein
MAQLTVELSDDQLKALERWATQQRLPVVALIQGYVDYLLAGGQPLEAGPSGVLASAELAALAVSGGAFDWLEAEPDLYTTDDGEPV